MKRGMIALMALFMAMLPSMAEAFVYTVEKGDCLWNICQRYKENVTEKDVIELAQANGIGNIHRIYPGDKITVPGGGSSSRDYPEVEKTTAPKPKVVAEKERIELTSATFPTYTVQQGDVLYRIGRKFNVEWLEIAVANGIDEPWTIYPGQELIVPVSQAEKVPVRGIVARNVSQAAISGNPAPQSENYMTKDASMASPAETEIVINAAPRSQEQGSNDIIILADSSSFGDNQGMVMIEEDKPSPYNFGRGDTLEFYFGAGENWAANPELKDGKSNYAWGKIRLIPLKLNHFNMGLFAAGSFADGKTEDAKEGWYEWSSKKLYGGLTLRPYGNGWDAAFEAGWGKIWKEGGIRLYESEQTSDLLSFSGNLSLYGRRNRGKNFLPKMEFNGEYFIPQNVEHEHSWDGKPLDPDPYSDKMWVARADLWIFDFWLAPDIRITPGAKLEYGYEEGPDEKYWAGGASIQMGTQKWNAFTISYKYKKPESAEREQHSIGGYLTIRF